MVTQAEHIGPYTSCKAASSPVRSFQKGICVHCGREIRKTDLECYDEETCILYMTLNGKDW